MHGYCFLGLINLITKQIKTLHNSKLKQSDVILTKDTQNAFIKFVSYKLKLLCDKRLQTLAPFCDLFN